MQIEDKKSKHKITYHALILMLLDLKDHVNKNSATISPDLFFPVDFTITLFPSPVAAASSIIDVISFPCSQVKKIVPVAFLKYVASIFVTSIDMAGFLSCTLLNAITPVLISAAIAREAK